MHGELPRPIRQSVQCQPVTWIPELTWWGYKSLLQVHGLSAQWQPERALHPCWWLNGTVRHWVGVRDAILELKPDIHICGHIHETQGIEEIIGKTRVINVGKSGKIIEL